VGPSGSHYIIGPLQKASGPGEKEKTTMSHFLDTHHMSPVFSSFLLCTLLLILHIIFTMSAPG